MMRRFLSDSNVKRIPFPNEFKEDSENLVCFERSPVGTLGTDTSSSTCSDVEVSLPHCFIRSVFDCSEIDELAQLFIGLRPSSSTCQVSSTYCKYSTDQGESVWQL